MHEIVMKQFNSGLCNPILKQRTRIDLYLVYYPELFYLKK